MTNVGVLTFSTIAAFFSIVLTAAYLRPNAFYAIGLTDTLSCVVFRLMSLKLDSKTILLVAYPGQIILALTMTIVLVATHDSETKFASLIDFSAGPLETQNKIGFAEANLYTLVMLTRSFAIIALMSTVWFGLSETTTGSAKRSGTIFGVVFAIAIASA